MLLDANILFNSILCSIHRKLHNLYEIEDKVQWHENLFRKSRYDFRDRFRVFAWWQIQNDYFGKAFTIETIINN